MQAPDGGYVAYSVIGEGPIDLLIAFGAEGGFSMQSQNESRWCARLLDRLSSFSRVVRFDRRGAGESDPLDEYGPATLEQWADDARIVLDAVGTSQAALVGLEWSGQVAMMLAASHPEVVSHLVLGQTAISYRAGPQRPWGMSEAQTVEYVASAMRAKLAGDFRRHIRGIAPSVADDEEFCDWFTRSRSAPPKTYRAFLDAVLRFDLTPVASSITAPTLVLCRPDAERYPEQFRHLADQIVDATYVELPGRDRYLTVGDSEAVVVEIEQFLTGTSHVPDAHRVLSTVMFSDIVDSTTQITALGDRAWHERLDAHDTMVRQQLERFRGKEIKTTGDGFLATFDGPARAIQCGCAVRDGARRLGIEVRIGMHTGEIELRGDDIGGVTVNIGARVAALASAGEVLVSRTVTDLVVGSGLNFEDRGEHKLKGVPGTWRLFAVRD